LLHGWCASLVAVKFSWNSLITHSLLQSLLRRAYIDIRHTSHIITKR
jgi:hypothetical protein